MQYKRNILAVPGITSIFSIESGLLGHSERDLMISEVANALVCTEGSGKNSREAFGFFLSQIPNFL